jgi:hypothetical protein
MDLTKDDCTNPRRLRLGYNQMAADEDHEREAEEWIEALISDVADEDPDRNT